MHSAAGKSVLHIDDDPEILRLVGRKLRALGFNVISLQDPLQVLDCLGQNQCSVVISDIDMPGLNGLDLLQRIKSHDGGIQIIMLTGLVSMSTVIQAMRLGADACVFKPLKNFDELTHAINSAYAKLEYWWSALRKLKALKDETLLVGG